MATITSSDAELSINITLTDSTLGNEDRPITDVYDAMDAVNKVMPISTCGYATGTATVTLKDARIFAATINPGNPPSFKFTSSNFWTVDEFSYLRSLEQAIMSLVVFNGMTAFTATYA